MVDLPVPLLPHTAATGQAPCLTTSDSSLATCRRCWAGVTGTTSKTQAHDPQERRLASVQQRETGGMSRLCIVGNISSAARSRAT